MANKKKYNFFLTISLLIWMSAYASFASMLGEKNCLIFSLCCGIILLGIYGKNKITWHHFTICPSMLFLVGYIFVFYYNYFLLAIEFPFTAARFTLFFASEDMIKPGVILTTCCLFTYMAGLFLFRDDKQAMLVEKVTEKIGGEKLAPDILFKANNVIGNVYKYIYMGLFGLCIITDTSEYYGVSTASRLNNFVNYFFLCFVYVMVLYKQLPILLAQKTISLCKYFVQSGWCNFVFIVYKLVVSLNVGDRGFGIRVVAFYFMIYWWVNRTSIWKILVIGMMLFYFNAMIGYARQYQGGEFLDRLIEAHDIVSNSDSYVVDATYELSRSSSGLHYVLKNMPDKVGYYYGFNMLYNCSATLPGLNKLLDVISTYPYKTSDVLISYFVQGENIQYGNGTNIIADFMVDFGVIGSLLGLFAIGILSGWVDWIWRNPILNMTLAGVLLVSIFFSYAVYILRAGIWVLVRPYIYCFILLSGLFIVSKKNNVKNRKNG